MGKISCLEKGLTPLKLSFCYIDPYEYYIDPTVDPSECYKMKLLTPVNVTK